MIFRLFIFLTIDYYTSLYIVKAFITWKTSERPGKDQKGPKMSESSGKDRKDPERPGKDRGSPDGPERVRSAPERLRKSFGMIPEKRL